jgi:hypothetical protein
MDHLDTEQQEIFIRPKRQDSPITQTAKGLMSALMDAERELNLDKADMSVRKRAERIIANAKPGSIKPDLYNIVWMCSRIFPA